MQDGLSWSSLTAENPSTKWCLALHVDGWIPEEKQASEGQYLGQETAEGAVDDRSRKRMKFGNNILEYLAAYQSQIMNGSNDTIQGAFGARRLCKRRTTWSAVHMGSGSRSRLRRPNDGHSRSIQTELFQLRFDDRWLQCYPCSKPGHKKQLHWLMRGGDGPSYHKKNQTNFVSLARSRNGRMSIEGDGG